MTVTVTATATAGPRGSCGRTCSDGGARSARCHRVSHIFQLGERSVFAFLQSKLDP